MLVLRKTETIWKKKRVFYRRKWPRSFYWPLIFCLFGCYYETVKNPRDMKTHEYFNANARLLCIHARLTFLLLCSYFYLYAALNLFAKCPFRRKCFSLTLDNFVAIQRFISVLQRDDFPHIYSGQVLNAFSVFLCFSLSPHFVLAVSSWCCSHIPLHLCLLYVSKLHAFQLSSRKPTNDVKKKQ